MRLSAPDVRIADVESCDFALMPGYDTETVLRVAHPDDWRRYLASDVSRRLMEELGVTRRYLTHLPGSVPDPRRLNALDLARSAVQRLQARRPRELERLDALIFVSTSNPNPCNCQAALLAEQCGLRASCLDLKAGCSGGVLGLVQAALLVQAGCHRVLVVMAENLSQLTSPGDLRMLLTVGDGAACVLVERAPGPGFRAMIHGTAPEYASSIAVRTAFPPSSPDANYVFESHATPSAKAFLHDRWRELFHESLAAGALLPADLDGWFFHQTHRAQVDDLLADTGVASARAVSVIREHGNMGSPTFAVAMARAFADLQPGQRYLMQAVGGGMSWCAILAEHC